MKPEILRYSYYDWPEVPFPTSRCIGNNKRRMLVLVRDADIPEHMGFLKKILRAIDYDFDTDILFATMQEHEAFRVLNSDVFDSINILFMFGIIPGSVGLNVHDARRVLKFDTCKVLLAPSLSTLVTDERQKRDLWVMLKEVFQI